MKQFAQEDIEALLGESFSGTGLVLDEKELTKEFFDLRSGFAGELIQKFTTYSQKLALLIPDPGVYGDRLRELAYEHNTHPCVRFVATREQADAWIQSDSKE